MSIVILREAANKVRAEQEAAAAAKKAEQEKIERENKAIMLTNWRKLLHQFLDIPSDEAEIYPDFTYLLDGRYVLEYRDVNVREDKVYRNHRPTNEVEKAFKFSIKVERVLTDIEKGWIEPMKADDHYFHESQLKAQFESGWIDQPAEGLPDYTAVRAALVAVLDKMEAYLNKYAADYPAFVQRREDQKARLDREIKEQAARQAEWKRQQEEDDKRYEAERIERERIRAEKQREVDEKIAFLVSVHPDLVASIRLLVNKLVEEALNARGEY